MALSLPLKSVSRLPLPVPGSTHGDRTQQDHWEADALLSSCLISPQHCPSILSHTSALGCGAPLLHHHGLRQSRSGPDSFLLTLQALFKSLLSVSDRFNRTGHFHAFCEFFINSNHMSHSMVWRTNEHFPQSYPTMQQHRVPMSQQAK